MEILKNKKIRSILLILLYFIIGFIILCAIKPDESNINNVETLETIDDKLTLFKKMNNYEYIVNNDFIVKVYNEKKLINYQNIQYDNLNLNIDPLLLMTNEELYELIINGTLIETGNNIINNLKFNTYENKIDNLTILLTVYENDNYICKIILNIDNYKYIYEYYNINEVKDW